MGVLWFLISAEFAQCALLWTSIVSAALLFLCPSVSSFLHCFQHSNHETCVCITFRARLQCIVGTPSYFIIAAYLCKSITIEDNVILKHAIHLSVKFYAQHRGKRIIHNLCILLVLPRFYLPEIQSVGFRYCAQFCVLGNKAFEFCLLCNVLFTASSFSVHV